MSPRFPSCSAILGFMIHTLFFPFLPRRNIQEDMHMQEEICDGVDPELNYSFPSSKAGNPHTYFGDIYSALSAFKELVLDNMV